MSYPLPPNEEQRLEALRQYDILDSEAEPVFDDITRLAALICGTPIALAVLLDDERRWFKSRFGFELPESLRGIAFCAHTILESELLIVEDARADLRFRDNPLVTSEPRIRFYAGAPLITPQGAPIGTLCVIDVVPRRLSGSQMDAMRALSRQVVALLESRRVMRELADALVQINALHKLLPVCAWCQAVRNDKGYWDSVEDYVGRVSGSDIVHGICPQCAQHLADRQPRDEAVTVQGE
ncbi:MAG: GAF domain-containing protein [Gammaproteobacteria bacterium]|nr:GAF domain-containing protein [Gammaproteobacteria bacterium]